MVNILSGKSGISLCIARLLYLNVDFIWFCTVICVSNTGVSVAIFKSLAFSGNIIAFDHIASEKARRQVDSYGAFFNE